MHLGQRYRPSGERSPAAAAVEVVGGGAKGKKQEKQVGESVEGAELRAAGLRISEELEGGDCARGRTHWRTRS